MTQPYALGPGQGWIYDYGINHVVKFGELQPGAGAAVFEYTTRAGEEPPSHSHQTEDEIFYVLEGEIAFHCDGKTFDATAGGFVYLPKGLEHGYTIKGQGDVRLLAITCPRRDVGGGWGGYVGDVERDGLPLAKPASP